MVEACGKYIAVKPTYAQKYVRLDNLGKYYTPDAINERIIAARNGIKLLAINKPKPDYNAWLKKYEPIKLKGFKALYYHYLYLFGKIRKREPPQRVCFYLREELIKFERYQKQFHFLYDNDIETSGQLIEMKQTAEDRILELTQKRSRLYHKPEAEGEIADINTELDGLADVAKTGSYNNLTDKPDLTQYVTNETIQQNYVTNETLENNYVTNEALEQKQYLTEEKASNTYLTEEQAAQTYLTEQNVNEFVEIKDGSITSVKLADGAVTAEKIDSGTGNEGQMVMLMSNGDGTSSWVNIDVE